MYKPSRHIDSFYVAGFQYHEGLFVFDELNVGTKLQMVQEADNPYDPHAIKLCYEGTMIGYVPRDSNDLISIMMTYGHTDVFECYVVQVNPQASPCKQVRVNVYITDKTNQESQAVYA